MALTKGTNCGFVINAPTGDPTGSNFFCDTGARAVKDTAPTGALKINQIGWWCDNATEEANFEVGLYSHNAGTNLPNALLNVSRTNAKGTGAGWKNVTVDWAITAGTIYWIAWQLDDTTTTTDANYTTTTGEKTSFDDNVTTLGDPYQSDSSFAELEGIYARYQNLLLGTNSGFVTTAPTADPVGTPTSRDGYATVLKDTSPATATKITEIGWWCDSSAPETNFEVGLYSQNVSLSASSLLYSDTINTKLSGSTGWQVVTGLDWAISENTPYWIGLQIDNTNPAVNIDINTSGGLGRDDKVLQTSLPDPFNGGAIDDPLGSHAIYAVWEAGAGLSGSQVNVADSWKAISGVQVNVGDVWKTVAGMQVNVGDVWKAVTI